LYSQRACQNYGNDMAIMNLFMHTLLRVEHTDNGVLKIVAPDLDIILFSHFLLPHSLNVIQFSSRFTFFVFAIFSFRFLYDFTSPGL